MKSTALAALALALLATGVQAQTTAAPPTASAPSPAPAAPATGAKFSLDTPLGDLAANPAAKAVLDQDIPGLTTNAAFDTFKGASLNQVAPYTNGKLTPETLAKVAADLAAIK